MPAPSIPIIITRAEPGAAETAARLTAQDLTTIAAPMLTLKARPDIDLPSADDLDGLVFTSANGVRTYASRQVDRHLPAWCVGPATAAAANTNGFTDIRESAGNAKDLAAFIAQQSTPSARPLLHVANAAAAGDLRRDLEARGFRVAFAALYEMRPAMTLPDRVQSLIDANLPAILLVHSAKGAAAVAQCLAEVPVNWPLVAISEQAAAPLAALGSMRTFIADAPNEDELMRALDTALATLSA